MAYVTPRDGESPESLAGSRQVRLPEHLTDVADVAEEILVLATQRAELARVLAVESVERWKEELVLEGEVGIDGVAVVLERGPGLPEVAECDRVAQDPRDGFEVTVLGGDLTPHPLES